MYLNFLSLRVQLKPLIFIPFVTAIIFVFISLYLCQLLIERGRSLDKPPPINLDVSIVSSKTQKDQPRRPTKPEVPHEKNEEIMPNKSTVLSTIKMDNNTNDLSAFNLELPLIEMNGLVSGDGSYFPRFKIPPIYPMRARNQGIEGSCLVEYTITETGSVVDVAAVKGKCTEIFKKPSIEAANKFLYRPLIVNGSPKRVHKVQNRFIYELQTNE